MTDIESNFLYRSILDNFRQQFDVACRHSYVIALPVNEALCNVVIDQVLVNSHILMPSKLLKMHYTPLQVGHAADDIEIDGKRLIVHRGETTKHQTTGQLESERPPKKLVIKILAEEMGYNSENRAYRMLIIDRPLMLPDNNNTAAQTGRQTRNLLSLFAPTRRDKTRFVEPPKQLFDHNDCSRYLESISQQLTVELESEVQIIQSKYMILSHYLQDAADRIGQLAEIFIPRYIDHYDLDRLGPHAEKIVDSIRVSVENYVIHLLHGKLIASIYHRYERCDSLFEKKLELIKQSQLSVCQLGAQEPFEALEISDKTRRQLQTLVSLRCPLAMVNTIVEIVDGISSSLDDCVRSNRLLMEFEAAVENKEVDETISICSDDLIASLIFALVQSQPSRIYSLSKYLELFNWSARDRAAYATATFHVVVQYIYSYKP